jgi:hypothetical protein
MFYINKTKSKKIAHCLNISINRNIIERVDTSNTKIHDHSLSCLGTGTSRKSGGVTLALGI